MKEETKNEKDIEWWEYRFYDRHSFRCEGIDKKRKEKKGKDESKMGKLSPPPVTTVRYNT